MRLLDYFSQYELTSDQTSAVNSIESFLKTDKSIFLLKGYAGTGKTTLLKGVCDYLKDQKSEFYLTAPTGRAAMILAQKTKYKASTIHRKIYNYEELHEVKEGDSFKFYYKLNPNRENVASIYFVDEASMVSDTYSEDEFFRFGSGHLLSDLKDFVFTGNVNRKIIFVGDDAQLPPVNMKMSPALNAAYLQESGLQVVETQLKQVVRQGLTSGILSNATAIRHSLEVNSLNQFSINYSFEDTHKTPRQSFIETYTGETRKVGIEQTIVITHSNRQAQDYNTEVRKSIFGRPETPLSKGDRLLIIKNNYNGPIEVFNGMFARVIEAGGIVYNPKVRFKKKGGGSAERTLWFRDVLVEVEDVNGKLHELRTTILDHFLTEEKGKLHREDQMALYVDFKNRMRENNIKYGTDRYTEALRNDRFFNALQAKYGYAITCHKSQGGEWKSVILDFKVFMGHLTPPYFRWVYTAITRASEQLFCIDAPDYNALSNFIVKDIVHLPKAIKGAIYKPTSTENPNLFLDERKSAIEKLSHMDSIEVNFIHRPNQIDTTFRQNDNNARVQLWFSNSGFTKTTWINYTSEEFKSTVIDILRRSAIPEKIPFHAKFPFQEDLHTYIVDMLDEKELTLTNISQKEWNDQYFIQTDADCALIEFWYDGKGMYTKAIPKSTLGTNDTRLQSIINKLRGVKV